MGRRRKARCTCSMAWSMDNDAGDIIFFPPVDAIQEFKVQTSSASAAYGGGAGVINVISSQAPISSMELLMSSCAIPRSTPRTISIRSRPDSLFRLNQFGFNISNT